MKQQRLVRSLRRRTRRPPVAPIELEDPPQRIGEGLGFVAFQKIPPVGLAVDVAVLCMSRQMIRGEDVFDAFPLEFGGGRQT
mmetsp:Transcript_17261/g.21208  ORF Transcript_17261/g.21208 Transcript_17261/m.21208 type:complete len:82 (-) Transcript_17261:167-412(-)